MKLSVLPLAGAISLICVIAAYAFVSGPALEKFVAKDTLAPNAVSEPVLPRTGFQASADRLKGFNVLSNSPPLPGVELHDEAGRSASLAGFRGKVVLFNLWATWCPPCIREMPDLNLLQAQYKTRGFVVVPVASGRQGKEEPAEFLHKLGLNELTTYYDLHSQFLRIFDLETLPVSFLVDRKGIMRGGAIGILDWQSDEAKALIETLLDETEARAGPENPESNKFSARPAG